MEVLMETKKAQPRFTDEFKIEAVKRVTERGHAVAEVAVRLGVSAHSLYAWIKRYAVPAEQRAERDSQADEIRRLKAELQRSTRYVACARRGRFIRAATTLGSSSPIPSARSRISASAR